MSGYDFDVLIIGGGGSGGFTAATTALKTGARVGMVESGRLGGLCILAGCMPSKALLHDAALISEQGLSGDEQYPRVLERKRSVVEYLAGKRVEAVRAKEKQGLKVISGRACFADPHTLEIDGNRLTGEKIVVASGSTEIIPPVPGLAEVGFLDSAGFMDMPELPASLVVLGGGTMALELGQYAARMGVKTVMIQRSSHLLSKEAPQVGDTLKEVLESEGVRVFTDTELVRFAAGPQGKTVVFKHQGKENSVVAQEVLLALGRRANTDGLNLDAAGVALERGAVKVDRFMRTSAEHIFAAGDVTGVNMVLNLAVLQGEIAGYNATHEEMKEIDDAVLPRAVFTDPQFARVGLNRREAEAAGLKFVEADYPLETMGVARTYAKPLKGFMAMRASLPDGRIIGAEIVAPEASLLIHDTAVAMKVGGSPKDLAELPYIHPCLSELTNLCAGRLARKLVK